MKYIDFVKTTFGCFIVTSCFISCSSNRIEDLSNIEKFHYLTTTNSSSKLDSSVDLYIDYSDCMTTAIKSEYYKSVQPAIIACKPNYYSIKGNNIKFETNDKMMVHQLLNGIKNVDFSNIKGAVDSIVVHNRQAILITDGEFYQQHIGASLNNPYLADEFKEWLIKGHDIYVYSEPYESKKFIKNRYYLLFTDHRIENNIQQIFSRNAPALSNVNMVHLYSGLPSVSIGSNGVDFNEQLLITDELQKNGQTAMESHLMDASWNDVYDYVLNALDNNGEPITGGDYFLKGIKLNITNEDAYMPAELEVKCYEVSDIYENATFKGPITLPNPMNNMFVLDTKAWGKGEIVVKLHPDFDGSSLTGDLGNLLRIDICVKKSKDNFSNNEQIGGKFKFNSPYGFNTSVYESLKQTLNDPSICPENRDNPVIYSIYLSTLTN